MGFLSKLGMLLGLGGTANLGGLPGVGRAADERERIQQQIAELRAQAAEAAAKRPSTGGFRPSVPERTAEDRPIQMPPEPQQRGAEAAPARRPPPPPSLRDESIEMPSPSAHLSATRAKLVAAFNATQPVNDRYELSGRAKELEKLLDHVVERGAHALIHGPRGSGKTSLARIFGDLADEAGILALYDSASGDVDFARLMGNFFADMPRGVLPGGAERVDQLQRSGFGPRELAAAYSQLSGRRLVLIVDEFDRIKNPATKEHVAALLKLLSDLRAPVQLVLVGISGNVDDLLAGHPSLRRHMVSVPVTPISNPAVLALINEGSKRAGISFSDEARNLIVDYALGSPYHARLYCLNGGVAALKEGDPMIGVHAVRVGMREAFADWSSMNERAAQVITQLAMTRDEDVTEGAKVVAVLATRSQHFSEPTLVRTLEGSPTLRSDPQTVAAAVMQRLQPLLVSNESDGSHCFDDSLAPHFLLLGLSARM